MLKYFTSCCKEGVRKFAVHISILTHSWLSAKLLFLFDVVTSESNQIKSTNQRERNDGPSISTNILLFDVSVFDILEKAISIDYPTNIKAIVQ